jgi:hypothetical protein
MTRDVTSGRQLAPGGDGPSRLVVDWLTAAPGLR